MGVLGPVSGKMEGEELRATILLLLFFCVLF